MFCFSHLRANVRGHFSLLVNTVISCDRAFGFHRCQKENVGGDSLALTPGRTGNCFLVAFLDEKPRLWGLGQLTLEGVM